jgi:hypothetical protein
VKANTYRELTEVSASIARRRKWMAEPMAMAKATKRPRTMTTMVVVADPPHEKSAGADGEATASRRAPDTSKARSDQPGSTGSTNTGREVV